MKDKHFCIALFAFLLASNAAGIAAQGPIRAEQMRFSMEAEMENPAAIPSDVLVLLNANDYVRSKLEEEDPPRKTALSGHQLMLTGPANNLEVKNTCWNNHREIELISMSAGEIHTVLCRFDGKQYVKQKRKSSPLNSVFKNDRLAKAAPCVIP